LLDILVFPCMVIGLLLSLLLVFNDLGNRDYSLIGCILGCQSLLILSYSYRFQKIEGGALLYDMHINR